ncbi:hypothetical protein GJAV_G00255740 [Gymnothorax javanicus]|nr:hypothetical protein GJAV_G00255740 [Gymnothorax javanicus]
MFPVHTLVPFENTLEITLTRLNKAFLTRLIGVSFTVEGTSRVSRRGDVFRCSDGRTLRYSSVFQQYRLFGKDIIQRITLVTAPVGDTVTLPCFYPSDAAESISWYKQPLGKKPQLVAKVLTYEFVAVFSTEFNYSKRFSAQAKKGIFNLTVSSIKSSDSATYYCATTFFKKISFGDATTLLVTGPKSRNRTVKVQQPESESVQPGDSMTLQCTVHTDTCAGEHSVYWFRQGSGESPPGIIYTHGDRSDECQRSSGAVSPTQSCVYNFPKRNVSPSDAGTYYCAVATCGEILFGNGTTLHIEGNKTPPLNWWLVGTLAFSVILNIIAFLTRTKSCEKIKGAASNHQVSSNDMASIQSPEETMNYAALTFSSKKPKERRNKREVQRETIYSDMRFKDRE